MNLIDSYNGGTIKNLILSNLFVSDINTPRSPLVDCEINNISANNMIILPNIEIFKNANNAVVSNSIISSGTLYKNIPINHNESSII